MSVHQDITFSIVSHGQLGLIKNLLDDLFVTLTPETKIILTINIPEDEGIIKAYVDKLIIIRNSSPRGFGANHNSAFSHCRTELFCILNPDIRIPNISWDLLTAVCAEESVGACAPVVLSPSGRIEDSARRFPSFKILLNRFLFSKRTADYNIGNHEIAVDWVAGMFVLYNSKSFQNIGGFDERYFMYLEDADICMRLAAAGKKCILLPSVRVVHDARRSSKKKFNHFVWHCHSAIRFLLKRSLAA